MQTLTGAAQQATNGASQPDYRTWAHKTLDAWITEHEGHGSSYRANCRGCLIQSVKHRKTSPKAKALFETTLASRDVYYINSIIQEYNLAENGVDFVQPLTAEITA